MADVVSRHRPLGTYVTALRHFMYSPLDKQLRTTQFALGSEQPAYHIMRGSFVASRITHVLFHATDARIARTRPHDATAQ